MRSCAVSGVQNKGAARVSVQRSREHLVDLGKLALPKHFGAHVVLALEGVRALEEAEQGHGAESKAAPINVYLQAGPVILSSCDV